MRRRLLLERVDWGSLERIVRSQQRNREKHTPVVSLYRWWARRPHALVGALLEAVSEQFRNSTLTISDPFSGGGTVAVEALKRRFRLYAQDLHPWATYGLGSILDGVDAHQFREAASNLLGRLDRLREQTYKSSCRLHGPSEIIDAFWVRWSCCRDCGRNIFYFPYSLITLRSRARGETQAYFGCSKCGSVTLHSLNSKRRRCKKCRYVLQPPNLPLLIDISINNGYIWHHVQGSSEASMQDHRSRWELLMRRMERRSVVPNSWMSFGVLLDKSCLALVQTNSSGLSCGAYPGKRWTRSLF